MHRNALYCLAIVVCLSLLSGCEEEKKPLTPQMIAAHAKTGAILIRGTFTANVTVPKLTVNTETVKQEFVDLIKELVNDLPEEDQQAINNMTEDEKKEFIGKVVQQYSDKLVLLILKRMMEKPDSIFTVDQQNTITESLSVTSTGSGFLLTPDGYAVTNAHVVTPSNESLKEPFVNKGLEGPFKEEMASSLKSLKNVADQLNVTLTDEQVDKILHNMIHIYTENVKISDYESTIESGAFRFIWLIFV